MRETLYESVILNEQEVKLLLAGLGMRSVYGFWDLDAGQNGTKNQAASSEFTKRQMIEILNSLVAKEVLHTCGNYFTVKPKVKKILLEMGNAKKVIHIQSQNLEKDCFCYFGESPPENHLASGILWGEVSLYKKNALKYTWIYNLQGPASGTLLEKLIDEEYLPERETVRGSLLPVSHEEAGQWYHENKDGISGNGGVEFYMCLKNLETLKEQKLLILDRLLGHWIFYEGLQFPYTFAAMAECTQRMMEEI